MDETPAPERKLTPKQRELVSVAVEGLLLVAIIGFMVHVWNLKHSTVTTNTLTVTKTLKASPTPAPGVTSLIAGPLENLSVPIDLLAAGYAENLQAPTAWRTVETRDLASGNDYPGFNYNDLVSLLRFVPEHAERNTIYPASEPINRLDILGTTAWATHNDGDNATPANKKAYLAYLGSLKTATDITAKPCTPIVSDGSSVCNDAMVKPQVVQTADGALSGVVYLYMQTQSASYDPSVVIQLAGTVAGKPVWASGTFQLYDSVYPTVGQDQTKVAAARKAFAAGNPPSDALAMYDRITAMVKSLRFAKK